MNVTGETHSGIGDTQKAISERKNGASGRRFAKTLGVHHATLHAIETNNLEHVSLDSLNRVRVALGLAPLPAPQPVPPCPSCLRNGVVAVHAAGDCHNRPVAAVVTLAPGETVVQAQPARQRSRRTPYGALSLRRTTLDRLAQHRTGRTADALINALLDKWEQEPTP